MEEREIDLVDLFVEIVKHWRGVLVWMIVGALALGAFGYVKSVLDIKALRLEAEEEYPGEEITEHMLLDMKVTKPLKEFEATAVRITIEDEKELASRKLYGDISVVLDMDPYNIPRVELVYELSLNNPEENHMLVNMYQDVMTSSGLFQWIEEKTGIPAIAARELIGISARSNKDYLDEYNKLIVGKDSMKIHVIHVDEETCKKLADAVKSYLDKIYEEMINYMGDHEIILISETIGHVMDMGILDKQVGYTDSLLGMESAIEKAKDAFTDDQMFYYNYLTGEEEVEVNLEPDLSLKMMILGAIVFAFLYAAIWMVAYVMSGKVRACDSLQSMYQIASFGVVAAEAKKGKKLNFIDATIEKIHNRGKKALSFEESLELASTNVKLAATKQELKEVCLLGCDLEAGADKVCGKIKDTLDKEQIKVSVMNNVLSDAEAMEQLQNVKAAVLVEKAGSSSYRDIEEEIKLLKRQDITILGGIIVE